MVAAANAPLPRKCETPGCDRGPCNPVLTPKVIDQSDGKRSGWVFDCPCGWRRVEPVR